MKYLQNYHKDYPNQKLRYEKVHPPLSLKGISDAGMTRISHCRENTV